VAHQTCLFVFTNSLFAVETQLAAVAIYEIMAFCLTYYDIITVIEGMRMGAFNIALHPYSLQKQTCLVELKVA
jgi:hypothetical protein